MAWNTFNPRLFAAGYDHAQNESSLIVWDIERSMNKYLNKVRLEEEGLDMLGVQGPKHIFGAGEIVKNKLFEKDFEVPGIANPLGKVHQSHDPKIITEVHQSFQNTSEDLYSIAWLPDSEYELIYSTEN